MGDSDKKEENKLDPEVLDRVLGNDNNRNNWKIELSDNEFEEYKKGVSEKLKILVGMCVAIVGLFFIGVIYYMNHRNIGGEVSEAEKGLSENIYESTTELEEDINMAMSLKETGYSITIRYEDSSFGSTTWQEVSRPLYYDEGTMLVYIKNDSFSALIPYMKDANTQYMWNVDKQKLY